MKFASARSSAVKQARKTGIGFFVIWLGADEFDPQEERTPCEHDNIAGVATGGTGKFEKIPGPWDYFDPDE